MLSIGLMVHSVQVLVVVIVRKMSLDVPIHHFYHRTRDVSLRAAQASFSKIFLTRKICLRTKISKIKLYKYFVSNY